MAFLWGVMFWEISRDVLGRAPMLAHWLVNQRLQRAGVGVA